MQQIAHLSAAQETTERVAVRDLYGALTAQERQKAAHACTKIMLCADILNAASVDLQGIIHRADHGADLLLYQDVKQIVASPTTSFATSTPFTTKSSLHLRPSRRPRLPHHRQSHLHRTSQRKTQKHMNMGKPQNNGLVEFIDDKQGMDGSWNCMDFHLFAFREKDKSWKPPMPVSLLPNQGTAV